MNPLLQINDSAVPAASAPTIGLFVALVVFMAGFAAAAILRVQPERRGPRAGAATGAAMIVFYLLVPGGLALTGRLDRYSPLPAPALVLILALTLLTIRVAFSPLGARLGGKLPVALLVGYQAFRIPVEWLLHRLSVEGVVPVEMTYRGRNFDIATGIGALVLGLWLSRSRRSPRAVLMVWNTLGLALLVNIVVVAVLATPVPFRRFASGPPNLLPSTFPFVWLPSFLVQLALLGHLILWRRLRAQPG